jgi:hypothetical protein
MGEEGRMSWLAICSGSYLKREGREIFPPAFTWKFEIWPSFAPDRTIVFEDALGLPKRVDLSTTNGQPVFVYRVSKSTNMLGWEFPLEFHNPGLRPKIGLRISQTVGAFRRRQKMLSQKCSIRKAAGGTIQCGELAYDTVPRKTGANGGPETGRFNSPAKGRIWWHSTGSELVASLRLPWRG